MATPGRSILIVDDNPGDARLVEFELTHAPDAAYRTARADRIASALERLDQGGVDLVLLDRGLPDSRGTEGLERIRARRPSVAVIQLTGSEDEEFVRAAIAAGAQDYLVKGIFPPGELGRRIESAVARQRLESAVADTAPEIAAAAVEADRDGSVLLLGSRPPVASPTFLERTGLPAASLSPVPAWLREIVSATETSDEAARTRPAGVRGSVEVSRADGARIELRYLARRWPDPDGPRVLVHLRDTGALEAPVPPAATSDGPIDEGAFAQLTELAGGDASFVDALLAAFLVEADGLVAELDRAASYGDLEAVRDLAHRLKSAAAQVGAMPLSRRCAELERTATDGADAARRRTNEIVREYPGVAAELARRRSTGSTA